jgi:uncharacterized protein (TIGR03000 family)
MPPAPNAEKVPAPKKESTAAPQPARVIVDLAADAKLFVDDKPTKATSGHRVFRTPTLEPGQTYYYELRAEVVRDGKPITQSKRILLRAGDEIRVSLNEPAAVVTAQAD